MIANLLCSALEPSGLAWEVTERSLELDNKECLNEVLFSACIGEVNVIIVLNVFNEYRFIHVSLGRHFTTKYLRFNLSEKDTFESVLASKLDFIKQQINELESRESVLSK